VPGTIPRSIRVDGVLEAFLKRKYVLPVAVLHPVVAGSLALVYLTDGRFSLPENPDVLDVTALNEAVQGLAQAQHAPATELAPSQSALTLVITQPSAESDERQPATEKTTPASMPQPGGVENTGDPAPASRRSGG
jgi:hypothetical protein